MIIFKFSEYSSIEEHHVRENDDIGIRDHLNGFDDLYFNPILASINAWSKKYNKVLNVHIEYFIDDDIKKLYPNLNFKYLVVDCFSDLLTYMPNTLTDYKNFLCTFNGTSHRSRQLLVTYLNKQGLFNPEYCSKNFTVDNDGIWGELSNSFSDKEREYYYMFFKDATGFNKTIYSFGHNRFEHGKNIYTLEKKLYNSFINVVSESIGTSSISSISEKFLYSIVTKGLFLTYASPKWHYQVHTYLGFKPYNKIFNYSFDSIQNPIIRLIKLVEEISKFSKLDVSDWIEMRQMEIDTIEYNYNHYMSKDYLKSIESNYTRSNKNGKAV